MTGAPEENRRDDDIDAHGKDLVRQTAEQDIVGRRGVLAVRLALADEGRARHLRDGGDHVGDDEEPQDDLGREQGVLPAEPRDEYREDRVEAGGEEDGRGDDEEVVEHKVDEVVRVFFRGQGACRVAYNLKDEADGKGDEPPGPVADRLRGVEEEMKGEPGGGKDGEGKGRREAVDDDADVLRAVGIGEVGVDVAGRSAGCCMVSAEEAALMAFPGTDLTAEVGSL